MEDTKLSSRASFASPPVTLTGPLYLRGCPTELRYSLSQINIIFIQTRKGIIEILFCKKEARPLMVRGPVVVLKNVLAALVKDKRLSTPPRRSPSWKPSPKSTRN
jgi:hypothetical protein